MLFVIANAISVWYGSYYLWFLWLVPAVLYLAFFSFSTLFMAVVFLTPLSLELSMFAGGLPFDASLPTEPVIVFMMLLIFFRLLHSGSFNRDILFHPVSLAILFYLVWIFITTITSTMPVVSVKFFLVRLWFIVVFYFLAIRIFSSRANIRTFLWCYIIALLAVVGYTLYNHAGYGLEAQRVAHRLVRPFYNDHTAYGAVLAMFIPVLAVFVFGGKSRPSGFRPFGGKSDKSGQSHLSGRQLIPWDLNSLIKGTFPPGWFAAFLLAVFTAALVFSYSRAAWLSLVAALIVWLLIRLRIKFTTIVTFAIFAGLLIFMLRHDLVREMERNTQDSSARFHEHVRSITNITSDASNLERINRWKAALAMFREKPLLGWGPGTYMFQYATFQYSYDRTVISTNFGDWGDAHSEYLGPLSESGLLGMSSVLVIFSLTLVTGFRLLKRLAGRRDRLLVTGVLLGLVTYMVHGTLNNFLHSDKAAVPFWGFTAILVAMDLYRKKSPPDHPKKVPEK